MDGNKKIKTAILLGVFVCFVTACSVKNFSYAGLYIDNSYEDENPSESDKSQSEKQDEVVKDKQDGKVTFSSKVISVKYLQDTITSEKLIYENKSSLMKENRNTYEESDQKTTKDSSLQSQNKKFKELEKELNSNQERLYKADSIYILTRDQKLQLVSRDQVSGKDTLGKEEFKTSSAQNRLDTLDRQVQNKDTVFIIKEIYRDAETKKDNSKNEDDADEENKRLQQRIENLESRQNNQQRQERQPVYIEREAPRKQESRNDDRSNYSNNRPVGNNANQMQFVPVPVQNNQQNQSQRDTVYIEKEAKKRDTLAERRESEKNNSAALNSKDDTINELKNRLLSNESLQKTDTVYKTNEVTIYKSREIDSVSVTAFYEIGKTEPSTNVLGDLKGTLKEKTIEKVMLSGYTDATGNEYINKLLTDKRLEYIKNYMSDFIPVQRIYVQNFGNKFASNEVIAAERRVEIIVNIEPEMNKQTKQ